MTTPYLCVKTHLSLRLVFQFKVPFPWKSCEIKEQILPRTPPSMSPPRGGHLPCSVLHCSLLEKPPLGEGTWGGEGKRDSRPRGWGRASAKKPSGALAIHYPRPGGALHGLQARGVTFPGGGSCSLCSSGSRKIAQVLEREAPSSSGCLPAA